ncbi:MAG: hypothetical protein IJD11_00515 [Oscillospiraceae bacterium]|nr:hypothetical protein [Oscillospiraceae bacterium]
MVHFDTSRMAQVKDTYERWWKGELDRPLINGTICDAYAPSHESRAPLLRQSNCNQLNWSAEEIVDAMDADLSKYDFFGDGYPQINMDSFGPGVLSAFCGADLDNSSGNVWFFPSEKKEIGDIKVKYDPQNPWALRIKDIYRAGMEKWNGSVVMGMPDLGGLLDVIGVFCGTEDLLFALIDEPEQVARLVLETQEAWHEAFNDFARVLAPQKAYSDWSKLLSATPSYILQSDFSYMISPDMFREFVLESLREDTRRLDHTIYHLDGIGQLAHLDELLKIKDLNAVQWVPGDGQPKAPYWMEVYEKIANAGKQMMVLGSADEFLQVLDRVHGSPYAAFTFRETDRDYALDLLKAR